MSRLLPLIASVAAALGVLAGVYLVSFRVALQQLERTGAVQLDQAADRLLGQLAPFQQLPNLMARHPTVTGVLTGAVPRQVASEFLANTALTVGADAIFVLNPTAQVVAASDHEGALSRVGKTYQGASFVTRALTGSLGVQHGLDPVTGRRDFFLARGVIDGAAPPVGVVVVRVDVAQLEFDWENDASVLAFYDDAGVIFASNRVDLPLMRDAKAGGIMDLARRYGTRTPLDFYDYTIGSSLFGSLWRFGPNPVMPTPALVLSQDMPRLDMTARIFMATGQAAATARLVTVSAAALLAMLAAVLWALGQRRRRLADRLAAEARANARLEARVEERTKQLRAAQDQLVQAGKLTALGQMSAGISHELNQPLAAIRNYAENGVKLIDRDRVKDARGNLDLIAEQSERITRIIRNLRAFARNEPEPLGPVDVSAVIHDALRLAEQRARDEGISLERLGVTEPVQVIGGRVRLQQVLVNLVSNAMDAVGDADEKRVTVDLADGDPVTITVCDTGPGIAEPDRVFEPFYTTKDIGASKGLGLGLSISYGIIGSFGGTLECHNRHPDPGAAFRIQLKPVTT